MVLTNLAPAALEAKLNRHDGIARRLLDGKRIHVRNKPFSPGGA